MTPRETKRAATLGVAASCFLLCITCTSAAQSEDSEAATAGEKGATTEGIGEKKPRLNSIRLSGVYAYQLLKERNSDAIDPYKDRSPIVRVTFACRTGARLERGSTPGSR